ncbi:MAG: hypothetical protein P9L99_16710 [Candidatus Lernaella stagnicola]|nr:hypothetical protein [Candidatus Lernaella stagnicola]
MEPVDARGTEPTAETTDLSSRVMRELLRTPAFREIAKLVMRDSDAPANGDLVKTLMWEDPNLSLSAAASAPRAVNHLLASIAELGRQLQQLPPDLTAAFLNNLAAELETARVAEIHEAWAPIVERLLREHPEIRAGMVQAMMSLTGMTAALLIGHWRENGLTESEGLAAGEAINRLTAGLQALGSEDAAFAEACGPGLEAAVAAIDFGLLREGVAGLGEMTDALARQALGPAIDDPVVLANVFGLAPVVVNAALRTLRFVVERIDLPDEVLASSVFNLLLQVDQAELGGLISATAGRLNQLHAGSSVLGGGEPHLRSVCRDIVDGVAAECAAEDMAAAVTALSEDLSLIAEVVTERALHGSEAVSASAEAAAAIVNAAIKTTCYGVAAIGTLPPEDFDRFMTTCEERVDGAEAARLVNALAAVAERLGESPSKATREFLAGVDKEQAGRAFQGAARRFWVAAQADSDVRLETQPERLGARVNEWLVRFNRAMDENPQGWRDWLRRFFDAVDTRELARAWRHAVGGFMRALFGSGERFAAIVKPVLGAVWHGAVAWALRPFRRTRKAERGENK